MELHTIVNGPLEENCFVVVKNNRGLVIDPGLDTNLIMSELEKLNLKEITILLTHGHYDHIASVTPIWKKYKCDVYVSKKELGVIDYSVDKFKTMAGYNIAIESPLKFFESKMNLMDFSFEVIETPGHSAGSVCLLFKESKIMFTGDTLFLRDCGRWDLYTGNMREMWTSLEKLAKIDREVTIYPGHYPGDKLSEIVKINKYIAKFA